MTLWILIPACCIGSAIGIATVLGIIELTKPKAHHEGLPIIACARCQDGDHDACKRERGVWYDDHTGFTRSCLCADHAHGGRVDPPTEA